MLEAPSLPGEVMGMGLLVPDLKAKCSFRNIKGERDGKTDPGKWGVVEREVELSACLMLNKTYQDSAENFSRIQMCYKKKKKKKGTAPISKVHS